MTRTFNKDRAAAEPDSAAITAAQVAAVDWYNNRTEIRVYLNDQQEMIQEYRWQGGGQWTAGEPLGGALLDTRVAAVQWLDKSKDSHLRVYYQTTANGIVEECYDPPKWTPGHTFTGVRTGAGIAALGWAVNGEVHQRLYYQDTSNDIVEQCYDAGQGWKSGHTFYGALPDTGIAAVYWTDEKDKKHQRVYYEVREDGNNVILEQRYDDGTWTPGRTFSGGIRPQTAIAAVQWFDSGDHDTHVRLYYQDTSNDIVEQRYDTPDWTPGHTFTGVAPGTGIAALKVDNTGDLRVYYEDTSKTVIEQCYADGKWTVGDFVAPTN